MLPGALTGFRVLDLTHFMAGPYCTKLLAAYGAEVIKIEKPGTGDGLRMVGPFAGDDPHPEKSVQFLFLNTGKKSITLNLKTATGIDIFKRLLKDTDIVVESFEPRVMPSLGLTYDVLSAIKPDLIMTSISSFGQTGPYRDYKATEIVEYALSGLMYMTGDDKREPLKLGLDVAQFTGGQNGVPPTLAALFAAMDTGKGKHIDISIMDYCAGLTEWQAGSYDGIGHVTERMGNYNQKGHPWGNFPCSDGWVTMAIRGTYISFLAELMNLPELMQPKFINPTSRLEHRDEFDAVIIPWLVEHSKKEPFEFLNTKPECAAGWVRNAADLLECPQLASQEFYNPVGHPLLGKIFGFPGAPCKMSETPMQIGRAPTLGEDNNEIYGSRLGFSKNDLISLKQAGII